MRVRLKSIMADETRTAYPGDEITGTEEELQPLVDGGYAELLEEPVEEAKLSRGSRSKPATA